MAEKTATKGAATATKFYAFGRNTQTKGAVTDKDYTVKQSFKMVEKTAHLLDDPTGKKDFRNVFIDVIEAPDGEFAHLDQDHVYTFDTDPRKTHVKAAL